MTCSDTGQVVDYFQVYRAEPEAVFDIPATADGHPPLTISIAALCGATLGTPYANNWIYAVHADGELVASGADLGVCGLAHPSTDGCGPDLLFGRRPGRLRRRR